MEFHRPLTVKEATAHLRKQSSLAVAGGTSFVSRPRVEHLIDLTNLGLNYIKDNKTEIAIGATTTATDILRSKALGRFASGILQKALSAMADTPLRNTITVGGDIACKFNWASLPPALIVLEAKLRTAGRKNRIISIEEFFKSGLKPGEIITEVIIPKSSKAGKGSYLKFTRTSSDYSIVTVAVYAEKKGQKISTLRVAVSGICSPTKVNSIEKDLRGKEVDENLIREVAEKAASNLRVLKSYLFSEDYRRELLGVLLKRAITNALEG